MVETIDGRYNVACQSKINLIGILNKSCGNPK